MSDSSFKVKNTLVVNGAIQANSIGIHFSNVLTLNSSAYVGISNNSLYLGGILASGYQTTVGLSANVTALTANNTLYVGTVMAINVVSNAQLSANLSNYQTITGLSSNVAKLISNSASYIGNIAAASLVASATTDTTNASNISSGTLDQARLSNVLFSNVTGQSITGGATVTSYSLTAGNFTATSSLGPLQFIANNGEFIITAPVSDGSVAILVTNGVNAGNITFSGFSVGTSIGDTLDTVNGHKFIIFILRIDGISSFSVKACQ